MRHSCSVSLPEIFKQSVEIYRKAFAPLLLLSAVAILSSEIFMVALQHTRLFAVVAMLNPIPHFAFIWMILISWKVLQGEGRSWKMLADIPAKFWRYITNIAASTIAAILAALLSIIILFTAKRITGGFLATNPLLSFVLLVSFMFGPLIYFIVRFFLVGIIACLEPSREWWTLHRSWRMISPHGWQVTLALAISCILYLPVVGLMYLGQGRALFQQTLQIDSPGFYIAGKLGAILVSPFWAAMSVAIYRAIRREEQTA